MSIHLCRFMVWIDIFALTASIFTLTFISFDRYLKISKPLQYKSRITSSIAMKIIGIIVLISTVSATYSATPGSGIEGILGTGRQKMLRDGELGQASNNRNQQTATLRQDMKVVRMLLVIVGVFVLCWSPWFISIFIFQNYPNGVSAIQ
ncbi:trace amine-associated receptor 7b-like [Dendronephthya gigantea]|uniref:trace amine-associated receptor 7b-like n=1 Tax=Dendronephthya gigantea TaxID=151771 RepID=UPI00106C0934|nr:trace amine-associated receptor 7b-like [Dendronephthya gigantea]